MIVLRNFVLLNLLSMLFATTVNAATPWEEYTSFPSPKNAKLVMHANYSDPNAEENNLYEDLDLLEIQVVSGDREAVSLVFRLRSESDGAYLETLDIMLGRLIRINPILFLEQLNNNRAKVGKLDSIVGNFGPQYVDRDNARKYELTARISALARVKDSKLINVRDECIKQLKIKELKD